MRPEAPTRMPPFTVLLAQSVEGKSLDGLYRNLESVFSISSSSIMFARNSSSEQLCNKTHQPPRFPSILIDSSLWMKKAPIGLFTTLNA